MLNACARGYSKYVLTECAAKGLKPLPVFKDFSPSKKKKANFTVFVITGPIFKWLSPHKQLILFFFFSIS